MEIYYGEIYYNAFLNYAGIGIYQWKNWYSYSVL